MGQVSRIGGVIVENADRWHVQWTDSKVELFAPGWLLVSMSRDSGKGALYETIATTMNAAAVTARSESVSPDTVISKIIKDIRDRKGLGDEWDNIDVDVRNEIVAEWREFFK